MKMKQVKLSDICVEEKGTYGIPASAVDYSSNLYTYLRITDINDDGTLNKEGLKSVSDERASHYLLKENDIVFARTGNSTGRNYFYSQEDGKLVYAGFLIKFSLDPQKVNPTFIKYYAQSKTYWDWVSSFNTGSTRGNINAQTYANMTIFLPERQQQDLLVRTLSHLDKKIAVNAQINRNLEQQAQAIFKSWFVDFEPFQDGRFVDSEQGPIPARWRVVSLKDIALYNSEKLPASQAKHDTYVSTENMLPNRGGIELASGVPSTGCVTVFAKNDVLLSNIRPYFRKIWYASSSGTCSTDVLCFRTKAEVKSEYLFCVLNNEKFFEFIMSGAKGTKMPRGDKRQMMSYRIVMPPKDILENFAGTLKPLVDHQRRNTTESRRLATLRDTLLPKLMSGEIDVSEVDV